MINMSDVTKREARNRRRRELYAEKKRKQETCNDMPVRHRRCNVASSEEGSSIEFAAIDINVEREVLTKRCKRAQVSLREYYCYKLQIRDPASKPYIQEFRNRLTKAVDVFSLLASLIRCVTETSFGAVRRELDYSEDDILVFLLQCAEQLPHKIPLYGTLVGLLNLENEDFVTKVIENTQANLRCRSS